MQRLVQIQPGTVWPIDLFLVGLPPEMSVSDIFIIGGKVYLAFLCSPETMSFLQREMMFKYYSEANMVTGNCAVKVRNGGYKEWLCSIGGMQILNIEFRKKGIESMQQTLLPYVPTCRVPCKMAKIVSCKRFKTFDRYSGGYGFCQRIADGVVLKVQSEGRSNLGICISSLFQPYWVCCRFSWCL